MSYSIEVVKSNVIRLINHLGCENGLQVEELKRTAGYDHPVNELPGKHTINNLKDGKVSNVKDHTFEGFVRAYNKLFNTSITIYDFKETLLPFESLRTIPDLYEGTYYLYDYWKREKFISFGIAHLYIKNNQYYAKMCLRILNQNTLKNPDLLTLFHDSSSTYVDYMNFFNTLKGEDKRMNYYEGTMELKKDYCVMELEDPTNLNTIHQQTVILRNYHYDTREKLNGSISTRIFKNYDTDIRFKRTLFSTVELDPTDPYIIGLLESNDSDIYDEQEYEFYKYVRNKQNG